MAAIIPQAAPPRYANDPRIELAQGPYQLSNWQRFWRFAKRPDRRPKSAPDAAGFCIDGFRFSIGVEMVSCGFVDCFGLFGKFNVFMKFRFILSIRYLRIFFSVHII